MVQPVQIFVMDLFVAVYPFISHTETFPDVSRQRMSDFPSPSKSEIPAIVEACGAIAKRLLPVTDVPSINPTIKFPSASHQSRSDFPSPLKSPVPAMLQPVQTFETKSFFVVYPFINDTETPPSAVRHKMSVSPSPLKSRFDCRGMTENVAALLVPTEVATVTGRGSGSAIEVTASVAEAEVGLVTWTPLTVIPLPAFTVRLPSNPVPVSVTATLVPFTPMAGVIAVSDTHEEHEVACREAPDPTADDETDATDEVAEVASTSII